MTTQASKFCPNCGAQLNPNAKFCPKCGFAIAAITAQPASAADSTNVTNQSTSTDQPTPAQPTPSRESLASVKEFSGNYFQWWLETIRHPATPLPSAGRRFGALTLAIEALLTTLSLTLLANKGLALARTTYTYLNFNGIIAKIVFVSFLLLLLVWLIYVSIGYGFRRLIDPGTPLGFLDYINQFASLTNLILAFNLIVFLVCLITGKGNPAGLEMLVGVLVPSNVLMTLGFLFSIVSDVPAPRMDRFYTMILALISLTIVLLIFGLLAASLIGNSLLGSVTALLDAGLSFYPA